LMYSSQDITVACGERNNLVIAWKWRKRILPPVIKVLLRLYKRRAAIIENNKRRLFESAWIDVSKP
jgi:hypothetical protein